MTSKHFLKNIFLLNKFCPSLRKQNFNKNFYKAFRKKSCLKFFQFLQNRRVSFIKHFVLYFQTVL